MKERTDTQEIIALAFQELTMTKEIDKISITDIMKQADFRRQTFYDHFDDKYDLVTWIFSHELCHSIQSIRDWKNWEEILWQLLTYLESNSNYYRKIFINEKLDSFKEYFIYSIKNIIQHLVEDYFKEQFLSSGKKQIIKTGIDFYSYGLSESLYHWVLENCEPNSKIYHAMLVKLVKYRTKTN
ncbi:dihydroxyacetone kinase transcriptional activator DhaS [Facklamia miroungae]|uniref:Probable dihydroxyacetone kinase regulator n=1 Tax=Facklamia miroungae TaxID=120956 RepID=A0A1G7QD15_9LACT|nr:dihydroxyacetone kinase transcriptional activator DhaS [Facklamia miroungae]NKZ28904.1 dihydroxyacetone kinase transcriptional activator DhaS [Facklamia miroungae]SDF96368.1 probable dihydroxyacetone kinase regulator [Facklamia miroungae]